MNLSVKWQSLKKFLFHNVNPRQTVLKNTFWLALSSFAGRLIRAGLIIYSARVLGTAGYGVFSYALGLAGFFSIFSDVGVSAILTREIAKNPKVVREYVSTSMVIKLVLMVISVAIILLAGPHFSKIPQALPLLPFAALLLVFDGMRDFVLSITRATEKMEVEGIVNTITNIGIVVLGAAILFLRPTPRSLTAGYTLGSGVGMLVAFFILREYFRSPMANFRPGLMKSILVEAVPFSMMSLLGSIMLNSDTIMLGWLTNASALGLYSAAQRPIQVLYAIPGFLSAALFPSFARLAGEKDDRFKSILERALTASFLIAVPMVMGGLALGKDIVLLLFGPQYAAAQASFMILLFTLILNFPSGFISNAVFAHGKQKLFIGSLTLGGLGNIIGNFLLIPRYGIVGSCIATIASQILSQGFLWYHLQKIRSFEILPHIKKIAGASVLMGLAVLFLAKLGTPVILNIAIGAGIYFGVLWVWKEKMLVYFKPSSFRA